MNGIICSTIIICTQAQTFLIVREITSSDSYASWKIVVIFMLCYLLLGSQSYLNVIISYFSTIFTSSETLKGVTGGNSMFY